MSENVKCPVCGKQARWFGCAGCGDDMGTTVCESCGATVPGLSRCDLGCIDDSAVEPKNGRRSVGGAKERERANA